MMKDILEYGDNYAQGCDYRSKLVNVEVVPHTSAALDFKHIYLHQIFKILTQEFSASLETSFTALTYARFRAVCSTKIIANNNLSILFIPFQCSSKNWGSDLGSLFTNPPINVNNNHFVLISILIF